MNNNQQPQNKPTLDQQAQRKLLRKSTWIILAGVSLAFFATYLVVKRAPSLGEYYASLEIADKNPHLALKAFYQIDEHQYQELNHPLKNEEKVIFKISTVNSVYVALSSAINNEAPHVVFHSRIPPGENRMFEKAGVKYQFVADGNHTSVRFCLLYAESLNQLNERIKHLQQFWGAIPEQACLQLR